MGILRRLFGGGADEAVDTPLPPDQRQAVTVLLRLTDPELTNEREQMAIYAIEDRLMRALDESGVGAHDSNELERGFLRILVLGEDAERMVEVVRPHLGDAPPGSYLAIRRGPEGTAEERIDLRG